MFRRSALLGLALLALCSFPGRAESVRELKWDDLVPTENIPADPLARLSDEQRADLGFVFRARALNRQVRLSEDSEMMATADEIAAELKKAGIDVDDLIARAAELREQQRIRDETVVKGLDGKLVRIPGYVLPVEYDGSRVTEFLLVPYVGACIHVPPPPPNQIVHVHFDKGFDDTGLFTPVYITGRMTAKTTSKSLYVTDGTMNITVGYTLQGQAIEIYKE